MSASADPANQRLLSLGEQDGLTAEDLGAHSNTLTAFMSSPLVTPEAEAALVRFLYGRDNDTHSTAQVVMVNIAKRSVERLIEPRLRIGLLRRFAAGRAGRDGGAAAGPASRLPIHPRSVDQ